MLELLSGDRYHTHTQSTATHAERMADRQTAWTSAGNSKISRIHFNMNLITESQTIWWLYTHRCYCCLHHEKHHIWWNWYRPVEGVYRSVATFKTQGLTQPLAARTLCCSRYCMAYIPYVMLSTNTNLFNNKYYILNTYVADREISETNTAHCIQVLCTWWLWVAVFETTINREHAWADVRWLVAYSP